jgi:hypothetical protein
MDGNEKMGKNIQHSILPAAKEKKAVSLLPVVTA